MKNNSNEKILVSACLLGEKCRFDGRAKPNQECLNLLQNDQAVAVCPEILGGLPIPRPACEICQESGNIKVRDQNNHDFTQEFILGAQKGLEIVKKLNIKKPISNLVAHLVALTQFTTALFLEKKSRAQESLLNYSKKTVLKLKNFKLFQHSPIIFIKKIVLTKNIAIEELFILFRHLGSVYINLKYSLF